MKYYENLKKKFNPNMLAYSTSGVVYDIDNNVHFV